MRGDRELYKTAIKTWGIEAQLDMVQEECAELIQAISKFKRASRRHTTWRDNVDDIEAKAIERGLLKAQENMVKEAADVWLMLQQLEVCVPGEYVKAREQAIIGLEQKLRLEGVDI